ncbi:MAG: LamG domain-containing protein, partial [Patescibacteria group bacterium]|nr:LamG domain-containing protein [Patescibacteria group bacterium]
MPIFLFQTVSIFLDLCAIPLISAELSPILAITGLGVEEQEGKALELTVHEDSTKHFILGGPAGNQGESTQNNTPVVLEIVEFSSDSNPDEFYIPVEEVEDAQVVEFKKKPIGFLPIEYTKIATLDQKTISNSPGRKEFKVDDEELRDEDRSLIERFLNKDTEPTNDFLTYAVVENEETGDIHAIIRSKKGLQKIVIKKDSLTSELYESEKLKSELDDWKYKASSTPVFQYQDEDGNWHDYQIDKESGEIKIDENEDYSLITQSFPILNSQFSIINVLKIGFDGENYFSKWTFKLDEDKNINRLLWQTDLDKEIEISEGESEKINENKKISKNNINIDWSDFQNGTELQIDEERQGLDQIEVLFYSGGIKGSLEIDPTLELTTPSNQIQIDVADKYRAVMNTGDTTNYFLFSDRAENDSSPDQVLEINGPRITDESVVYSLAYDASRTTTILENTPARVRIRVEGCFDTAAGSACLKDVDDGNDDELEITEEWTFTPEGIFEHIQIDFKDGIELDGPTGGWDSFQRPRVRYNQDASNTHNDTVLYGDGTTESSTSNTGNFITGTDNYIVLQGTGSYQDIILGEMTANGDRILSNSSGGSYYLSNSASDVFLMKDGGGSVTLSDIGEAQYFLQFHSQTDLDTETEREAMFNDLNNPDTLTYTTGSEWDNAPATPGLEFDGSTNYVTVPDDSSIGDDVVSALSVEMWFKSAVAISTTGDTIRTLEKGDCYFLAQGDGGVTGTGGMNFLVKRSNTVYAAEIGIALNADQWYHIAGTFDGTDIRVYLDGVLKDTTNVGGNIDDDNLALRIGSDDGASYLDGIIDEVRIWSDVRTEAEIQQNMFKQVSSSEAGLVGYWRFNDNTGTNANDETSNNNDGTLTLGPTWRTGYVPDQYNEAEGAYTLDAASSATYDKASMVQFDIDGGTYTRHQPTAKIRKWRSTNLPAAVSLEGSTLYPGTSDSASENYNASLKPISDAYFADELLFHQSCESDTELTSPDVGGNVTDDGMEADDYPSGKYGNACDHRDGGSDRWHIVDVGNNGNLNGAKGAIEFWFQPAWNHDDNADHEIFKSLGGDGLAFDLFKRGDNNELWWEIDDDSISMIRYSIASTAYSWNAGDWVHIRVEWNEDNTPGSDEQKIFINGVEPAHTDDADDFVASNYDFAGMDLYFSYNSASYCNCLIDEIRIYGGASTEPDDLAQGGDTGDSDEYLADISDNYTLDFDADDASNRGEYLFLGSDDKFTGINYHLATQGVDSSAVFTWQYWDGGSWASLTTTNEIAGSNNFTTSNGTFYWSQPYDWAKYSVNGSTDLYYIRGHLESGSFTTDPIESFIKTDVLLVQYLGDISSNDQTFIITSDPIVLSGGSVQIDVPNRYRAIMETGDTTDFIKIYDRAQNDSSPNATHEIRGPCILETNTYCLRDDANRKTTIIESNSTRAKVRVEGKLNNEASTDYLDDDGGDDDVNAIVDYTFTTEGIFIENQTDFKDGVTLDADSGHNGYEWLGVWADVTDAAFDDTGNIIYGNGTTEATTTTDGAEFEDSNKYVVLPGTGSDTYQDAFVGIQKYGWYDDTGGTDEWHWDEANDGTQDLITAQEQNHLTAGKHYAKWFFLMLAEDDLDTEAERESYINDYRNPDTLVYTTGSEWDDAPASPGLEFDGTDDHVDMNDGTSNTLDFNDTDDFTIEAWFYRDSDSDDTIVGKKNGESCTQTWSYGYVLYVEGDDNLFRFRTCDSEQDGYIVTGSTTISNKKWYHVAAVWDQDSASGTTIYLNGIEDKGSTTGTIGNVGSLENSQDFDIGAHTTGTQDEFKGIIDEVRVWSDVRSASEIEHNMFNQVSSSEAGLVGYWRLNENTGTSAEDETTNNNDGTLTSGPTWVTGHVPDYYNESESAYTIDTSSNETEIDI